MISGQTAEETAKVGAFARRTTFPMPLGFIGAMQVSFLYSDLVSEMLLRVGDRRGKEATVTII